MTEEEWLSARDRAMLYMRALSLPPLEGLEFVLEALNRAQREVLREPGLNPTAETMRILRELLADRPVEANDRLPGSHPPLNRGAMVPEGMDRRLWRIFPAWLLRPAFRR